MVSKQKEKKLVDLFEKWSGETAQRFIALPRSGSDREYYRIVGVNKKAIAAYNPDKKENQAFVSFSRYFDSENLPVPEIYAVREEEDVYLLQDLGDTTLYSFLLEQRINNDFPDKLVGTYKKVLSWLVKFQIKGGKGLDFTKCYPRDGFDLQSMKWDMHYFKYYFLKLAKIPFNEQLLEDDFETFANFLLEADRDYFLYRDFQSRNVMLIDNEPFFIDYQGGRKGALQYDLASILYDAKADIPADTRKQLLLHYIEELQKEIEFDVDKFTSYYWGYVYIRIMQALGAYGFRGFYERKEHFLQSIPFAINNLEYLLKNVELPVKLPALTDAFQRLTKSGKLRKIADTGKQLTVRVNSFSFKRGIPVDESGHGGGFVFDCRAVENPGRYKEFRELTGKDKKVKEFLDADKSMKRFLHDSFSLVDRSVENYLQRGFTHLMISFGCTGGRHRSVYAAEKLIQYLKEKYNLWIILRHREQEFLLENPVTSNQNMKAIIFAAGLGTRLKDITNEKPKALVEVNGVSLLEIAIRKLKYFGFKDIIINVHHFSEQIKTFVKNLRYDDLRITVSDESFKLLGTGGGIKKTSGFFSGEEAFLAYNVDVITNLDLGELYRKHITSGALATLAVRKRDTSRYLLIDDQNILCGWYNAKTGERIISREKPEELTSVAFSGIHIISTQLPGLITEDGYCNIIDVYLRLASEHDILTIEHDSEFWFDVGTPEHVKEVSIFLKKNKDILPPELFDS